MLVLTRKLDEAIIIDGNITIKVVGIAGDKVRIGVDAPRSVRVLRAEAVQQTIEQNKEAASASVDMLAFDELRHRKGD